jgi:hypothetical protein
LGVKRGYKVWKNYSLEFLSDYGQERRLLSTLTESGAVTRLCEHIIVDHGKSIFSKIEK